MPACSFDYAVIRVVPRVERGEFLNAGVLLFCATERFLEARIEVNRERLGAFAPWLNFSTIEEHLEIIPRICAGGIAAGPIGHMTQSARFHWLVAPRSTIIQFSPVHSGLCDHPAMALDHLFERMVRLPSTRSEGFKVL